jgi:hypothetical protein
MKHANISDIPTLRLCCRPHKRRYSEIDSGRGTGTSFRFALNEELQGNGLQAGEAQQVMDEGRTGVIKALLLPRLRAW